MTKNYEIEKLGIEFMRLFYYVCLKLVIIQDELKCYYQIK